MGRKIYLSLALFIFIATASFAQTGEIQGRVIDKQTREPIPFATVTAELNGNVVNGAQTDANGKYSIKPLTPGRYNVKVEFVGNNPSTLTGVLVTAESFAKADFELTKGVELEAVEVVSYKIPLIDPDNTTTQSTMTQEEIKNAAVRDVNSLAANTAGIYQQDVGGALFAKGSRSDATAYYVDGIKLSGAYTPPQSDIEQVTVITGGIPAQYGDATGAIISITTRGPSKNFIGGGELYTSKYLDPFATSHAEAYFSGPILMKRDTAGRKSSPLAGYFIAGEYNYTNDDAARAIGGYVVKSDILADLQLHPLVKSALTSGFDQRADYITLNDLQHIDAHLNSAAHGINISGKVDIAPSSTVNVTLGGSVTHGDSKAFTLFYELFNYDKNPEVISNSYHLYGRVTQQLSNYETPEKKANATIKDAFYTIQLDYTHDDNVTQSADHTDNYFDYGYVGKFTTYRTPAYTLTDTAHVNGNQVQALIQTGFTDTLVTYKPSPINQVMANYTSDYYALQPAPYTFVNGNYVPYHTTESDIVTQGGLINGDNRTALSVYSLWGSPGRQPLNYSKSENDQYRVTFHGEAKIKDHAIMIGLEYEQRIDRGYNVNASALWGLMRGTSGNSGGLANFNIQNLDYNNPHPVDSNGVFQNVINYDYKYVAKTVDGLPVKGFFENVRDKLGIPYNQWIDIDSYSPSTFSLNMFTPDELLNNGSPQVSYVGYDYLGNKVSGNYSISDFFNNKDAGNNYTRRVGAFQPNYTAGYIEDKFTFNDINFRVGLRVDRYDANQPVLKDKYLLYAAHTSGEVASGALPVKAQVPGNIPSGATVYVNDVNNPTTVVGYRNADQFYDANGTAITDYQLLAQNVTTTGTIQPYLITPEDYKNQNVRADAFTQYTPQVNYMPRISFSFPISDEALFYAHYDVLTQRPTGGSAFNPVTYLFFPTSAAAGTIANPDLQPTRTTDYELGFKQVLTKSSVLSISGFYRELRDEIETVPVNGAFPVNYTTFGNKDFGTVKGITLSYDLRRTQNLRLTANYTLQFADGTGSNPGSQTNVISAGLPNLLVLEPLDFDQRNTIVITGDYRYSSGKEYNGPIAFGKQIFSNTGLNVGFHTGSGTPYTRQSNITEDVVSGLSEKSTLEGSINGSRLPWSYRIDAKLDKSFTLKSGNSKEGGTRKRYDMDVYVSVINVLNTQNIFAVYRATGNPNDNGYLSSAAAQVNIAQQVSPQAYRDLFAVAVNNPFNYQSPRSIIFGVKLNFE